MNKVILYSIILLISGLKGISAFPFKQNSLARRGSIHDRTVHIEEELVLDIPHIHRLCNRMDLIKRHLDIGKCELQKMADQSFPMAGKKVSKNPQRLTRIRPNRSFCAKQPPL